MVKVRKADDGRLKQLLETGHKQWFADVPEALGGNDEGPEPHELLDSALGACTALTVTMVARRKQIPLTDVRVEITHEESGGVYRMSRKVELVGELSSEQREYLIGIANKCPVHKTLTGRFEIVTELKS
ncbi:MAG: OsmC family protein [Panacagrimonas sp.]